MHNLPIATIIQSERDDDLLRTVLELDRDIAPPLAPASLWLEQTFEESTAVLELHRLVKREARVLTFETYQCAIAPLIPGSTYAFIAWWGAQQLAVAQTNPGRWRRQEFALQDAVQPPTKDGAITRRKQVKAHKGLAVATMIPHGRDHENCLLCWQTISLQQGQERAGYTDGKAWLCETCYTKYIASGFGGKLGEAC
jgi:hypothetical protein